MAKASTPITIEASTREVKEAKGLQAELEGGVRGRKDPSIPQAPRDFRTPLRIGIAVIVLGIGSFLLWAAYAPLDEGVPSPGTLIVDSKRKTVQNAGSGIVKQIHVKEGDLVQADQLLITMDPVQSRAQREVADTLYTAARAAEARLLAEQRDAAFIEFPPDLLKRAQEANVAAIFNTQRQLFDARRQSLASELASYQQAISGLQAQSKGLVEIQEHRQVQVDTLGREFDLLAPLVRDGLYAKNRHQDIERQLSNAKAALTDGTASIARLASQIAETKLRINQRQQEFRKEVQAQLAEVAKEARAQAERLVALDDELRRTEVRGPVSGSVVGLNITTQGAVLAAGTRILDVIPSEDRMIVEAQISPHLIERIKAGIPAKLMFTALNPRTTPIIDGKLMSVSADLLTTPQGVPYYLARVEATVEELAKLGNVELHAGMPVEVIVVTGQRSLLNYIFKPIEDRMARGLKER